MKPKTKALPVAPPCLAALLAGGLWLLTVKVYNDNFQKRLESYEPLALRVEDFAGLERTKYTFPSDRGQMLTGYLYRAGGEPKGILVLAHGYGAGHNFYMECANFFARNGYLVFAYDATGNDESEGKGVGGLPQGVIDLEHAIRFVEESGNFPALPVVLFGHSWGGYSACSVLAYRPEVKAVIECSGCNRSSDLFEAGGREQLGPAVYALMPFVKLHERIKFGKYASASGLDGFAASSAAVMAVHSEDDPVVPIRCGFDLFRRRYGKDPRFVFLRLRDRGHGYVFDDTAYLDAFNAALEDWRKTLDYDGNAPENRERFAAEKAAYVHRHLDRAKWSDKLDKALFQRFLAFYDEHLR